MAKQPPFKLLDDPDVRRWYDNLRRSSRSSSEVRLRRLNLFCDRIKTTPARLAALGRKDPIEAENILLDHVSWMEKEGYSPGYTHGMVGVIKSWFTYNHVDIRRRIKIANADVPVTIQDEKIPEGGQLGQMFDAAPPRTRAIMSLMAFTGVRPQALGLDDRSDGLRLADLPDLVIDGREVSFSKVPAMVVVRQQLSKSRNRYFTFLTKEGCQYVLGYLRGRVANGERLRPESPLITVSAGYRTKGWGKLDPRQDKFLVTGAISGAVRKAVRTVMKARPYVLRAYFDSQLLMAESHGCMTHAYRQFFMGHKGDMEARYTTNKGRLADHMVEDMRRSFAQSQPFLSTKQQGSGTDEDRRRMLMDMWRQQAKMYGMDVEELLGKSAEIQNARAGSGDGQDARVPRGLSEGLEEEGGVGDDESGGKKGGAAAGTGTGAIKTPGGSGGRDGEMARATANNNNNNNNNNNTANNTSAGQGGGEGALFETKIVDGEDELLASTAQGWDLVKDMQGARYLMRRQRPQTDVR